MSDQIQPENPCSQVMDRSGSFHILNDTIDDGTVLGVLPDMMTILMTEGFDWAVFNDEGMLEGGLSEFQAQARERDYRTAGDRTVYHTRECPEHEGQDAEYCAECDAESEEAQ